MSRAGTDTCGYYWAASDEDGCGRPLGHDGAHAVLPTNDDSPISPTGSRGSHSRAMTTNECARLLELLAKLNKSGEVEDMRDVIQALEMRVFRLGNEGIR